MKATIGNTLRDISWYYIEEMVAPANNICWDPLTSSGSIYSGPIYPTHTADGTLIYDIQFDTSTGVFIAQFGIAGDEQLDNVSIITLTYQKSYVLEMQWDEAGKFYTGTDLALAAELALEDGNRTCFGMYVSPDQFLNLDLETEG